MAMPKNKELEEKLIKVLADNDQGGWTVPAGDLYPHQWLWDSCFIAIGLRHIDTERAKEELRSLLRGQWSNGMMPHMILNPDPRYTRDRDLEKGYTNPFSPNNVATSGITQPPMLAEAVWLVGQKLKVTERRSWYREMFHPILRYHEWLYYDRDPHQEGLVINIHPWETGLDNSPPWISELRKHSMPWWITAIEVLHLDSFVNLVRRDTRHVPPGQRMSNIEAMAYWAAKRRLIRKAYNSEAILSRSLFAVQDVAFNSILIRANECLELIAKEIKGQIPDELKVCFDKSRTSIEELWDETAGEYFSRSFVGHKLIEEETIASLLPLYSGAIKKDRAERLIEILKKRRRFSLNWPIPSVPLTSAYFDEYKYWQGPTWVNTNWLLIQGLKRNGQQELADALAESTIKLVEKSGPNEYFSPLNGDPAGADNFSWTAALTIDLLHN